MKLNYRKTMGKIIAAAIFGIFFYLTFCSFCFSYQFSLRYNESASFMTDVWYLHLFILIPVVLLFKFLPEALLKRQEKAKMISMIFLLFVMTMATAAGFIWVNANPCIPCADQRDVFRAAIRIPLGLYSYFRPDGYLGVYQFQIGLVTLFEWILHLAGQTDYHVIMYANVCCLPVIIFAGYQALWVCYENRRMQVLYCIFMLFCFPLLFYTPFIYGEIFAVTTGISLIWMVLLIIRRQKIRYLLPAVFFAVIGVWSKGSNWIPIIASVIFLLLYSVRRKQILLAICAVIIVLVPISGNKMLVSYYENLSGTELNQGVPLTAWIAMGLHQEYNEKDGWYDAYNYNTYADSNFQKKETDQISRRYIAYRLGEMAEDKKGALLLFQNKILTQWDAPDYESLAANSFFRTRPTGFVYEMYFGQLHWNMEAVMDEYQWILYLGVLMGAFAAIKKNREPFYHLIFMLTVLGGFLFTLIWEAKTRYTMVYLIYMIPCAVYGWEKFLSKMEEKEYLKKVSQLLF